MFQIRREWGQVSLPAARLHRRTGLDALQGSRAGQYSIRVNDQFRLCFRWTAAGPEDVEIVDYH
jgi:proteic killer suppression protein